MNQSELLACTSELENAQEKSESHVQDAIGFRFVTHWLKKIFFSQSIGVAMASASLSSTVIF